MRNKPIIWGFSFNSVLHLLKDKSFSIRLTELKLFAGPKCPGLIIYGSFCP